MSKEPSLASKQGGPLALRANPISVQSMLRTVLLRVHSKCAIAALRFYYGGTSTALLSQYICTTTALLLRLVVHTFRARGTSTKTSASVSKWCVRSSKYNRESGNCGHVALRWLLWALQSSILWPWWFTLVFECTIWCTFLVRAVIVYSSSYQYPSQHLYWPY